MQSPTKTAANLPTDPFVDLVHTVHLSLQPSTSDNPPTVPADMIQAARQSPPAQFDHHAQPTSSHRLGFHGELHLHPTSPKKRNIHKKRCYQDLRIHTIQGKPLGCGHIRYFSPALMLRIGCLHTEEITFLVLEGSTADLILGRPWMSQHQPRINWTSPMEVLQCSDTCFQSCLPSVQRSSKSLSLSFTTPEQPALSLNSTTVESPEVDHKVDIPPEYWAFQDVFSKRLATQLPPHRPWDCAIDLLPGARLYPLSIPEKEAIEEYIQEALQLRFIRPSTFPAASSCFFVAKNDGGLRPCIDYRHLNSQTVKYSYPLPLVPSALEKRRGAYIFSKLDLRSAYNLICIRRDLPFVVEVDASSTGVGAVLSQRQGDPPRLYPCAFYSKKLSPAEQNYGIGNRELLKLALEEWRHWLEGAHHKFEVITDHCNLEYLQEAKR
ncbi:hypothetical protein PO909_025315 [Leuciscus waleckii]